MAMQLGGVRCFGGSVGLRDASRGGGDNGMARSCLDDVVAAYSGAAAGVACVDDKHRGFGKFGFDWRIALPSTERIDFARINGQSRCLLRLQSASDAGHTWSEPGHLGCS